MDESTAQWEFPAFFNSCMTEMQALKDVRKHVEGRIAYAERQQNMRCRPRVRKWLLDVQSKEDEVAKIGKHISQFEKGCGGCFPLPRKLMIILRVYKCISAMRKLNKEGDFDVVAHHVNPEAEEERVEKLLRNHSTTMKVFMSEMVKQNPRTFSSMELESFTSNFSYHLGSGGYGEVYKGMLPTGVQIAVKVLKNNFEKIIKEQFMAEVSTIGRTYHRNLVRLYGFCFDVHKKALVYEYMENSSLDNILFNSGDPIDWEKIPPIAIGIAKGLSYLHEDCHERLVHYDIKPGNILLDSDFSPKIADFGLSKFYDREITHVSMSGFKGTPGYAAPEIWKRTPCPVTYKCDVYSYGIMLFELVGRRKNIDPNLGESQQWFPRQVWKKLKKGEVEEILMQCGVPNECRERAKKMLMVALACIQQKPNDRPPMGTVVKILEGELEAMEPANPFHNLVYLNSDTSGNGDLVLPGGSMESNDSSFSPSGLMEFNHIFSTLVARSGRESKSKVLTIKLWIESALRWFYQ